jgi:hypothetical protein
MITLTSSTPCVTTVRQIVIPDWNDVTQSSVVDHTGPLDVSDTQVIDWDNPVAGVVTPDELVGAYSITFHSDAGGKTNHQFDVAARATRVSYEVAGGRVRNTAVPGPLDAGKVVYIWLADGDRAPGDI